MISPASTRNDRRSELRQQLDLFIEPLESIRQKAAADVVVFYLACDPFLPAFLRCLNHAGKLQYPEACSHFRLRPDKPLTQAWFCPDARKDPMRSGLNDSPLVAEAIARKNTPLFGDFVHREGILSRGWFAQPDAESGQESALLTVSYRRPIAAEQWRQSAPELQAAFTDLLQQAAPIRRRFQEAGYGLAEAFVDMLDVIDPVRELDKDGGNSETRLRRILERAFVPLDSDSRRWCGTIHLLGDDGRTLELAASVGDFQRPATTSHRIDKGEGVISWVALRQQAVHIRDLRDSPFRPLHIEYLKDVRSQLVVPLLAQKRLLGTLSLETTEPDAFHTQHVGYLSRVGSLAAMDVLLSRFEAIKEERDQLLQGAYRTAKQRFAKMTVSLDEFAPQPPGPSIPSEV